MHRVRSFPTGTGTASRALAAAYGGALAPLAALDTPRDLDVMHYPVTVPIPRTRAARVVSLLDVQHHELPAMFSRTELAWRRWAYDRSSRQADVVVTISEHARRSIVERLGVDPKRILAIPLGVDHARFRPEPADVDATLKLPERYLLYPANMWPHKNHDRLLRAFATVTDPDLGLVLTGQSYGRSLPGPRDRRVRHLGHVSPDAMPALYRRAVGMIFPSLFEGFGLPVLEAMACGCPVAACGEGAVAEVADDAAVLFNGRNETAIAGAIERMVTDAPLRDRLRRRGLERAAGYTWTRTAERHVGAYEVALTRRSARMAR
ncbi:MAG: glycosyltransferase family 4 protein [Actinomycetota bacterium]|nr:glycosyltransferase family 4 protein [Actinomycetota bacterium]